MTIRPIRTKEDHQAALKRAKALFGKSGQSELDEREVLQALIEKWERSQHAIEAATPAQAIKFRMQQTGLSQRDLPSLAVDRLDVAPSCQKRRLRLL